jgi:hypothetical protein
MSGEGALPACPIVGAETLMVPVLTNMADVIAYLDQRIDNCDAMARSKIAFVDDARERRRQLEVIRDDFRAGLHQGAAMVRATLASRRINETAAENQTGGMS